MADGLTREQLLQLARLGAEKRLEALRAEIRAVEALVGRSQAPAGRSAGTRKRRRPRWSPEKRKAAAERMKAYWAKRKAKRK
jgi:hypothetical protein